MNLFMKLFTKLFLAALVLVAASLFLILFGGTIFQALQTFSRASQKPLLAPNFCVLGSPDSKYSDEVPPFLNVSWLWGNETSIVTNIPDCCIIVMKDDGEGRYVGKAVREAIASQVNSGAGLIAMGSAGLLVPQDPAIFGWDYGFGGLIPVKPSRETQDDYESGRSLSTSLQGVLFVEESDDAVNDVNFTRGLTTWGIMSADATADGDVIASIRTPSNSAYPAIVAHKRLPVYYSAFNAIEVPGFVKSVASVLSKNCAIERPSASANASVSAGANLSNST
jgi:hypothetical protein